MMNDPRLVLERLCAERGEDFAGLSRMLGRNSAYIQQFVRRGVPKRLGEDERRKLARYFGISEALLGGRAVDDGAGRGLVRVKGDPVVVSGRPRVPPEGGGGWSASSGPRLLSRRDRAPSSRRSWASPISPSTIAGLR